MKTNLLLLQILTLGAVCSLQAATTNGLASPSPEVREAAAKIARDSFVPAPRGPWASLTNQLQTGMTESNMLALLKLPQNGAQISFALINSNTASARSYRLDNTWILATTFKDNDRSGFFPRGQIRLISFELREEIESYEVPPSKNFTGLWTTYFANGRVSASLTCQNGKLNGPFTHYYSDGSKWLEGNMDNDSRDGLYTEYSRSGKKRYQVKYDHGKVVGLETWYKEDGSIESTRDSQLPALGAGGAK